MDFCISAVRSAEDDCCERVGPVEIGGLWWSWRESGNLEILRREDGLALVSGTLFGPLRRTSLWPGTSPKQLGRDADRSNGSFAVAIVAGERLFVVTDAGGSVPVFFGNGPAGFALGSRAHQVSRLTGLTRVDDVSVADSLRHSTVCHPFTWYEGIRVLPPGSVVSVAADGVSVHTYWEPAESTQSHDRTRDVRQWGHALRDEVQAAVLLGIRGKGRARVLFSGGEDSRAIASLLPRDLDTTLATVLDSENREYRLARRAALALRRRFEWVRRPSGYYLTYLAERVATAGQGMDMRHVHVFGDVGERYADADDILGGYLSDPLRSDDILTSRQRAGVHEALSAVLADREAVDRFLTAQDVPDTVRWRARTLAFDGAQLA